MSRWAHGLGLVAGVGIVAVIVVSACLPDLPPNLCGNGHIDPNEGCDPGTSTNPGCDLNCAILCQQTQGDPHTYYFDENLSAHCYFTTADQETEDIASFGCGQEKAHLVTFVDDVELNGVIDGLASKWSMDPRFWVGFSQSDAGSYFALAPHEPGWNTQSSCSGCFLHGVGVGLPPVADGGAEAGFPTEIVATQLTSSDFATMDVMGPAATASVVCEREPVGARSVPCFSESFCFDTLVTKGTGKGYLYSPSPATFSAAEATCRSLSDAGNASLVVFESRAEREQVIYELTQVPLLKGGVEPPSQFWIGLHTQTFTEPGKSPDGGVRTGLEWVWDDGNPASPTSTGSRPSVWGNHQPAGSGPSHAFIQLQSTYDTGLAYAREDTDAVQLPFVCQYQ